MLVFDYMLSDLAEVVRNSERPLTEASKELPRFDPLLLFALSHIIFPDKCQRLMGHDIMITIHRPKSRVT